MVNEKYVEALKSPYQKLEVTFDGDLIDACRGEYVIKAIEKYSLLLKVRENSEIIEKELSQLFLNYRSVGYLIAFDFFSQDERDSFVSNAYSNKLLVNPTAEKSIRIRPNLAFSDNELDELLNKINIAKKR
jgi:L-lysine 6-transaminase